jgi:hypothetical protein
MSTTRSAPRSRRTNPKLAPAMAETQTSAPAPQSIDAGIDAMIHKAEQSITHVVHDCEDFIRQSPTKAVVGALAAGYLLRNLPLRALLVAKVRLITALAPPALVLYGAAKVYEFIQEQSQSQPQSDTAASAGDRAAAQ